MLQANAGLVHRAGSVPVDLSFAFDVSADGPNVLAQAQLNATFLLTSDPDGPSNFVTFVFTCGDESVGCHHESISDSAMLWGVPGLEYNVGVFASGGFRDQNQPCASPPCSSEFQAVADPIIQIADQIDPESGVSFRDEFSLVLSDGVVQGIDIPEPGSLLLLGMGLAGLALQRIRQRQAE